MKLSGLRLTPRILLFTGLLAAASLLLARVPSLTPETQWRFKDGFEYLKIAESLRSFHYPAGHPFLFPPGWPLLLALLPFPLTWLNAMFVSVSMFFVSIGLLYWLVAREVGRGGALLSALLWAVLWLYLPAPVAGPMSETTFCVFLLAALLSRLAWARGLWTGLAILTRPEAYAFLFMSLLFQRSWKQRAVLLGMAFFVISPYLLFLHFRTGRWSVSGVEEYTRIAAAYRAAGMTWQELRASNLPLGPKLPGDVYAFPSPHDPKVIAVLGAEKARKVQRMQSMPRRVIVNSQRFPSLFLSFWPYLFFGVTGAVFAFRKRCPIWEYTAMLVPVGFFWLPYMYEGPRFFIPLLLCLSLGASGWVRLWQSFLLRLSLAAALASPPAPPLLDEHSPAETPATSVS